MVIRSRGLYRTLAVVAAIGGLFAVAGGRAAAAPAYSITTSPVAANVSATPGKTSSVQLHIMNNNQQPVQVSVKLNTFTANGSNGEASVLPLGANDSAAQWVHFSQSTFTAQPGIWTPITMTLDVPKTASLGYYFAVLFEPTITTPTTQHTNVIKGSNAVLVLVDTHTGNEQRKLQVTNFSVSKKLYEYLPTNFNITVKNTGNIYVPPTGDIYISKTNNFSKPIDIIPVNKGAGNVLPQSVRNFDTSWTDGFPVYQTKMVDGQALTKKGKPVMALHWDFTHLNKLRFGKYYAHLVLVYNNGKQDVPIDSVVSFWVVPWKLLLVALLIVVLLGAGLYAVGRSAYKGVRRKRKPANQQ